MHATLDDILRDKGQHVHTIDAAAPVLDGVRAMVEANVGSLLVTREGRVSGIFTERDFLRRVALEGRAGDETTVGEVMSAPLLVATRATTVDEAMALMTDRRIRHIPVVAAGDVVGIVSIGDLVKFTSRLQSFELKYLNDYITAR